MLTEINRFFSLDPKKAIGDPEGSSSPRLGTPGWDLSCSLWTLRKSHTLEKMGMGHNVLKWGLKSTFPRNQDVTVKLKSELIFAKF